MVLLPFPGDEMRIGLEIPIDATPAAADVPALVAALFPDFPVGEIEVRSVRRYQMGTVLARRFGAPGAVIVGDAAHTTHPITGQGMNLGIADAEALTAVLPSGGTTDPARLDAATAEFHERRYGPARKLLFATYLAGHSGPSTAEFARHPLRLALRTLDRIPAVRARLPRLVSQAS